MKTIEIEDQLLSYSLRKSRRARGIRISIYCDGSVVVSAPFDLKESMIEKFICEKSDWLFSKIDFFRKNKIDTLLISGHEQYLKYKDQAIVLVNELVELANQTYFFKYNKITIKNQKTRWGSCSNKGNLNFNYKIVLLPRHLAEYIIAHELSHLKELNHSKNFWRLVEKTIPDYRNRRRELNACGMKLR